MHKVITVFLTLYTLVFAAQLNAQSIDKAWDLLLNNQRAEALREITEAHKANPTVESLLSKEFIKVQNGDLAADPKFLDALMSFEDNEAYIYAFWNEKFLFDEYISTGMNQTKMNAIKRVGMENFENQTLRESMLYLQSVVDRYMKNHSQSLERSRAMSSVRQWQYCGPFENMNNGGIDVVYPPESMAFSEKDFNANSNGWLNWYEGSAFNEGYNFFTNHVEFGSGVHFAQTFMNVPSAREAYINVGASGKVKVWLNDVLVLEELNNVSTDVDAYRVKVNLPAGNNRLLVKLGEPGGTAYFIVRVTDAKGVSMADLQYSSTYSAYQTSTEEELRPEKLNTIIEQYFQDKVAANPDNFLYQLGAIANFMRNGKYEEAKELIEPWNQKYPKSSFLSVQMIRISRLEENYEKVRELQKNIENDDPEYYLSRLFKFEDVQELFRMSMEDMNKVLSDLEEALDDELIHTMTKMMRAIRVEDKKGMKKYLDGLTSLAFSGANANLVRRYAPLYQTILSDDKRTLELLEQMNAKYYEYSLREELIQYYDRVHQYDKVVRMMQEECEYRPYDVEAKKMVALTLLAYEQYKDAQPYFEEILKLFPYSFVALEGMGDVMMQLNKEEQALEYYNRSLLFNSGNSSLRKKIRDLNNKKDIFESYRTQDVYKFIKQNRGKGLENNYGFNFLLDETLIELYEEAGGKARYTKAYEITSEMGVEDFTEYEINGSSSTNIIKSELIKPDGRVVPASRNYGQMVFNGLEIGDVIYIDYQDEFNGYGRFYRDFTDSYLIDSYHPVVSGSYRIFAPKSIDLKYEVKNGEVELSKEDLGEFTMYSILANDMPAVPDVEDYMPANHDILRYFFVSTIPSWNDIANWYSDLVRPQVIINSDVRNAFNSIFPNGEHESLSEAKRAEKIYYYIAENFNYSYVPFLQSSHVPQKPAKTIQSKLGDCKDFSTLYMTLAQMAGLKAHLVLVLTSDNGVNGLVMPSQDFNHCIVNVTIDGKPTYLELTDKYLPFMAIPASLQNALILDIPNQANANGAAALKYFPEQERMENADRRSIEIRVNKDTQTIRVNSKLSGAARSTYYSEFEGLNNDMRKKTVADMMEAVLKDKGSVDSVFNLTMNRQSDSLYFSAQMTIKEKPRNIGSFKVIELPVVSHAYTGVIVSEETREYPIFYKDYEVYDHYESVYDVYLEEGNSFVELPENVSLSYGKHRYTRTYELVSTNHLRVHVNAFTDKSDISVEEYPAFKAYVTSIVEAKEVLIGYK